MNSILITLSEYWSEGVRPRTRIGRIIVPLIMLKITFLLILWCLFFGPSTKIEVGAQRIDDSVFHLSMSPVQETRP
jgi:hypothetical protein